MSSRPARPARPDPPPAALEAASRRADIRWCLDCGAVAVQSRTGRCQACGGFRVRQLGFSDLYEAYAGPLRRFVRRLAADRGLPESLVDTDGVVHDTFMVLLSGSREPIRNPGAWLFTVARNQVSKAAATQGRIAPGDPAIHLDGGGTAWASLASPADAEEIRAAREAMRAIAGLPGHQKIATYLRQVEGWSLAEVGAYLNCAASTAGVHISRGTTKVRASLSGPPVPGLISPSRYMSLRRRRRWRGALAAAGALLAAATALALSMPWWLTAVTAMAGILLVIVAVRALDMPRWLAAAAWWPEDMIFRRLAEEIEGRRRLRRFNRWLRTGRALAPPTARRR